MQRMEEKMRLKCAMLMYLAMREGNLKVLTYCIYTVVYFIVLYYIELSCIVSHCIVLQYCSVCRAEHRNSSKCGATQHTI